MGGGVRCVAHACVGVGEVDYVRGAGVRHVYVHPRILVVAPQQSARKHGVGALLQGGARGSVRVTPRKPAALRGARVQVDIVGAIHGENFEAAHVEGVRDAPQLLHVVVELGAPDDGIEPRHDHRTALLGVSAARIVRGARYTLSEFQNGFMVDL